MTPPTITVTAPIVISYDPRVPGSLCLYVNGKKVGLLHKLCLDADSQEAHPSFGLEMVNIIPEGKNGDVEEELFELFESHSADFNCTPINVRRGDIEAAIK